MNAAYIFIVIAYLAFILFILSTAVITLFRNEKKPRNIFSGGALLFAEVIFTMIGPLIGFLRFDEFGPEIPFSQQHVLSIIGLVIISSLSFWLARFTGDRKGPLIGILLSVGMLQGIILCFFVTLHFLAFIPLGILWPFAGFELLSPLMAMVLLLRELYFYNQDSFLPEELLPYRNWRGFMPLPVRILEMPFWKRLLVFAALLVPFLLTEIAVAYAFGQEQDAIIKAFTYSNGFIFSSSLNE